jgi:hypothetical protein
VTKIPSTTARCLGASPPFPRGTADQLDDARSVGWSAGQRPTSDSLSGHSRGTPQAVCGGGLTWRRHSLLPIPHPEVCQPPRRQHVAFTLQENQEHHHVERLTRGMPGWARAPASSTPPQRQAPVVSSATRLQCLAGGHRYPSSLAAYRDSGHHSVRGGGDHGHIVRHQVTDVDPRTTRAHRDP